MDLNKDTIDQFIAEFRARQPLWYGSTEDWPDDVLARSLYKARPNIGKRWGVIDITDPMNIASEGLFLWAAHWLFVTYQLSATNISTNLSPQAKMNIASKSVADESVSFRITQMQKTTDDWLSLSEFGVEFLALREQIVGGFAVGDMPMYGGY